MEERACCFVLLSYGCHVAVNILWLFLTVPWVGLRCVIAVFPDHTQLPFYCTLNTKRQVRETFGNMVNECPTMLSLTLTSTPIKHKKKELA